MEDNQLLIQLLKLIHEGKSTTEIKNIMALSYNQLCSLFYILKEKHIDFGRKYYQNGKVCYVPKQKLTPSYQTGIFTRPSEQNVRILLSADFHFGSFYDRVDLVHLFFRYAFKNDIHLNIIAGDFIDGFVGECQRKHQTIEEQILYALKVYPHAKNLLHFLVLGNHDFSSLQRFSIDFAKVVQSLRHDIVCLGYGEGKIHLKNDILIVRHPLVISRTPYYPYYHHTLMIKGHYHQMKVQKELDNYVIYVPSLSDIQFQNEQTLPGFIDMNLTFQNGYIKNSVLRHMVIVNNNIYQASIHELSLEEGKPMDLSYQMPIHWEEDYKEIETPKKLVKKAFQ